MRQSVLAAFLLTCTCGASAQIRVETVATGFDGSGDVAVGPGGDVFVGDYGSTLQNSTGSQVVRITPEGEVSVFVTGLSGASGNTFDADGNFYQSSIRQQRVVRVEPDGTASTYASGLSGGIIGLAFDAQGNLYANDCGNHRIYRISPDQTTSVFVSGPPLSCPNGLTIDDEGNLYAVNFNNSAVVKITPAGAMSILARTPIGPFRPGGGNGHVTFANGVLYVAVNATSQIVEVSLDGEVRVIAGTGQRGHADGDPATATFSFPNGIDVSPDGRRIYVNEAESTAGSMLTSAISLDPARLRVIVLEEEDENDFEIDFAVAGAWFDPDTAGQGFLFEPLEAAGEFFGAWFTFETAEAKLGAPGQRWLTLQGGFSGPAAELTIFETSGGRFDDPRAVDTQPVGEALLEFEDCRNASIAYAFDQGPAGEIDLIRIADGALCPEQATVSRP